MIYAALGRSNYVGAEIDGLIVLARFNGKIIKALGSTSTLEDLAKGNGLDGMIASYRKAGGTNVDESPSVILQR